MGICSRAAALLLRVTRRRPGLGFCAAARTAAASLATRVPSKKRGFCVPYSLTAFVKVKARKSSGVMRPSSTSRHAHDDCDRIHLRRGDHPAVVVETQPDAPSAARRLGAVGSGGADRRQLHLRTGPADPGVGRPRAKFTIIDGIDRALKHRYEAFLARPTTSALPALSSSAMQTAPHTPTTSIPTRTTTPTPRLAPAARA
jgi:hypothetical protein